jgi:hypothetical protein
MTNVSPGGAACRAAGADVVAETEKKFFYKVLTRIKFYAILIA